jgi:hypothetical protein
MHQRFETAAVDAKVTGTTDDRILATCVVAAGILTGVVLVLSPLGLPVVALAGLVIFASGRGLDRDEQRILAAFLIAGLAVRLLVVLALLVASSPSASAYHAGVLFGDEVYSLGRSLRTRDILLGVPASKLDYEVMFDTYADTRYMSWLSWIQFVFGPSAYTIRMLNGVLSVGAAAWLYRLARRGFGMVPSLGGLAVVLFLPSLLLWSVSLLKESLYFLMTVAAIGGALLVVRGSAWGSRAAGAGMLAVTFWLLADMRPGAVALTGGGLAAGFAARTLLQSRRRLAVLALAALAVVLVLWRSQTASARMLDALTATAKQHTGHVFTVGHAYKTLDAKFYATVETPSTSHLRLTPAEAARYVLRSGFSFLTVPLPWQVATRSELAFLPEQLVWYVLVIGAIAGLVPAWRRDSWLTAFLAGYVLAMAAALALTNGNVGTLVRLRGLVTPFLAWLSALGGAVVLQRLLSGERRSGYAVPRS